MEKKSPWVRIKTMKEMALGRSALTSPASSVRSEQPTEEGARTENRELALISEPPGFREHLDVVGCV